MEKDNYMSTRCYLALTENATTEPLIRTMNLRECSLRNARYCLLLDLAANGCNSVLSVSAFLTNVKIAIYRPYMRTTNERLDNELVGTHKCSLVKTRSILRSDLRYIISRQYFGLYGETVKSVSDYYEALYL